MLPGATATLPTYGSTTITFGDYTATMPWADPNSVLCLLNKGQTRQALIKLPTVDGATLVSQVDECGRNALHVSIAKGHNDLAKALIAVLKQTVIPGAPAPPIDWLDRAGNRPFLLAAQTGNIIIMNELAQAGADLKVYTDTRSNAFHLIFSYDGESKIAALQILIDLFKTRGYALSDFLTAVNTFNETPLTLAVGLDRPADETALAMLLAAGAGAAAERSVMPLLHRAVNRSKPYIADILWAAVPPESRNQWINHPDAAGCSALRNAVMVYRSEIMVKWLLAHGADPYAAATDSNDVSIIEFQLSCDGRDDKRIRILQLLLASLANLNQQNRGRTLLEFAVSKDYLFALMLLIINGADPALPCHDGRSLLQLAETLIYPHIANLLKAMIASDVPAGPDKMRSALWHWVITQQVDWVERLYKLEAFVEASREGREFHSGLALIDSQGNTPLHTALELGNADVACKLISLGASLDTANWQEETPLAKITSPELLAELKEFFPEVHQAIKKHKIAFPGTATPDHKSVRKKGSNAKTGLALLSTPPLDSAAAAAGAGGPAVVQSVTLKTSAPVSLPPNAVDSSSEEDWTVFYRRGPRNGNVQAPPRLEAQTGRPKHRADYTQVTKTCQSVSAAQQCRSAKPIPSSRPFAATRVPVTKPTTQTATLMSHSESVISGAILWETRKAEDIYPDMGLCL